MFKLVLMEGKGAGLVALRDIVAGTLLVSESPALRVTLLGGNLSPMAAVDVSRQFCSKSKEERKVIMDLANNYEDENEVLGIFKTNAMIISDSESALFPWVCRANHSCVPNCNYMWNEDLGEQQLFAMINIPVGIELTVSYLPDNLIEGVEERQKYTLQFHNFICMCDCCAQNAGIMKTQDENDRKVARRLMGEINTLAVKIRMDLHQSGVKMEYKDKCVKLLNLLQSMNIHLTSIFLVKTCLFYISVLCSDVDEAVSWAAEVLQMSEILTGLESYQTKSWISTVNNVRSYFRDMEGLVESVRDWSLDI